MNMFDEIEMFGAGMFAGVICGVVLCSDAYVPGVSGFIALTAVASLFSIAWVLIAEIARWFFKKIFGGKK
jgi:hypothetical protein